MTAVWSVALITFKEGIKSRVIFGIFIIALLLFAAFTSNSFIALVLSLVAYIIGQSTESVRGPLASQVEKIEVSPIMSYMVEIAYYVFPNMSAFDLKMQAAHGLKIGPDYFIWTILYAIFYIIATLAIGTLAFRRREFP